MARPERPIRGDGPAADLARELRRIRAGAGHPGYRELAAAARFSKETLSAAARGGECPSWEVTRAFADACDPTGAEARRLRQLWETADKAARRRRVPGRRRPRASADQPAGAARRAPVASPPRPDPEGTPAEYVYQLRALRAWAGRPGHAETAQRRSRHLPRSTMYDAISPRRTTLPPLRTVKLIVLACLDDEDAADEWVMAWRAISLREFTSANPRPVGRPSDGSRAPLRIVASQ